MDYAQLASELGSACGPSGYEDAAREKIAEYLSPYADEIKTDAMGNIIAMRRCGKQGARCLMLCAHMDEVGFVVTGHEKGYLRFACLGGVDARMLPACEMRVLTPEPLYGVVDVMPVHALTKDEQGKPLPADKLFIDVGLSQEQAEQLVPPGTPVVYGGGVQRLGAEMLCGKAMDDRSCAAIIIKLMEALKGAELDMDLCCLISTQEELGTRGAVTGAYGVSPDWAIVLDVTHAETPDAPKHRTFKSGGGAAIGVGPNFNKRLTDAIIGTAKECGLEYQLEVISGNSGTDAWPIQVSRSGVAAALVSLPLKYMHSPVETLKISDVENIIELLTKFILRAGEVL